MPFKTRDAAIASLKEVTIFNEYAEQARDAGGNAITDEAGDGVWIGAIVTLSQVFAGPDDPNAIIIGNDDDGAGLWFDYYGECRGETPWIHEALEAWAVKHDASLEWRDPGSLILYPNTGRW